jgi:predicted nuclease of restriction endonuclease-like RecB superfamily
MALTQNEAKIAFTHILHVVFGRAAATPLQLALEEEVIDNIFKHINLDAPTINNLQYADSNNNNAIPNVRTGDKMLVKSFLNYIGV